MENKDKNEEQSSAMAIVPEISLSVQGQESLANLLLSERMVPTSTSKELMALPDLSNPLKPVEFNRLPKS